MSNSLFPEVQLFPLEEVIAEVSDKVEWDEKDSLIKIVTHLHSNYVYDVMTGECNYPPVEILSSEIQIPVSIINSLVPRINQTLILRGYEPYIYEMALDFYERPKNTLDPFFLIAVDLVTDTIDKRSTTVKLKQAGLTSQRWNNLLKDKRHYNYFKKIHEEKFKQLKQTAEIALSKNVESGDLQSIKFFFEYDNIYRPETELGNISIILAKLMEILVQYVQPSQLQEVADKFEGAINAKAVELQ